MRSIAFFLMVFLLAAPFGCALNVKLFTDAADPLQEFTLSGTGKEKVLLIPVKGVITDRTQKGFLKKPSIVQDIVSQLRLAEKDPQIKAVVLKIDSPGGSTTASDIVYHEIMQYKSKSGAKVVVAMMGVAASGGYYIALPADHILAHPTTVTGSVGVIMLMPKVDGLMKKIGVAVDVHKSGANKDMGSPFRPSTAEEQKILEGVTGALGGRFLALLEKHRQLDNEKLDRISTARIFIADEAESIGLVDEIGYLSDALKKAKQLSGLAEDARVVVYRRTRYADDNVYNTATTQSADLEMSLVNVKLPGGISELDAGFYYLWLPGVSSN